MINHQSIHRTVNFLIGGALVFAFLVRLWIVVNTCFIHANVNSWGYTEFLINFGGGVVRRGIFGEVLYVLSRIGLSGDSIMRAIQIICLGSYLFVLLFFIRQFHRRQWNWWLLMSTLFMGLVNDLLRKDFLMMTLLIIIIYILQADTTTHKARASLWCATLCCALALFIHEAFMFWGVPVIVLLMLTSRTPLWQRVFSTGALITIFILLCHFKGSEEVARQIVASWQAVFPTLRFTDMSSIGAIGWDTAWTAHFHITKNFFIPGVGWIGILLQAMYFLFCSYVICNCVYVFSPKGEARTLTRDRLVSVYAITAVCMIPMFTFLSVDIWRLYQYLAVTSFATVIITPAARLDKMFPQWYGSLISNFNKAVDKYFTPSKGLMVVMIFMSDINGIYERGAYDVSYFAVSTFTSIWHGFRLLAETLFR